jgi:hypothetical protein
MQLGQTSAAAAAAAGSSSISNQQQSLAAAAAAVPVPVPQLPQLQQLATIETGDKSLLSPNGSGSLHPHLAPPDEGLLRVSAYLYIHWCNECFAAVHF